MGAELPWPKLAARIYHQPRKPLIAPGSGAPAILFGMCGGTAVVVLLGALWGRLVGG